MRSNDIVLGILNEKPATGYEIKERFSTIFSHFYNASFGSVYPILHKLAAEGKVSVEEVIQTDRPNKKIYSITDSGREAFAEYLTTPIEPTKIKWDFMLRLFYADLLDEKAQRKLIADEIQATEDEISALKYFEQFVSNGTMTTFQHLSLRIGLRQKYETVDELKRFQAELWPEKVQ